MRRLLLALPFALIPLAIAHAADEHDHDHEHGSLRAHVHGVARLDMALECRTLEFELDTPAMNIVGFEHPATTDADTCATYLRAVLAGELPVPEPLLRQRDALLALRRTLS